MLDAEKILELKNKYGPIFTASIKGQIIVFRELKFSEFDYIALLQESQDGSTVDSEDEIIKTAVVYPEDFNVDKIQAGLVSSLAQEILDASGFSNPKTAKAILEQKRMQSMQVRSLMKAFVLATIKTYSPEDLDQMTYSQLAEKVALAERIIEITQNMHAIEPNELRLELIDPEEEEEKKKKTAARHNLSKTEGAAQYDDPIAQKLWGMNR